MSATLKIKGANSMRDHPASEALMEHFAVAAGGALPPDPPSCPHTVKPAEFNAMIADLVMTPEERSELVKAFIRSKIEEYRACPNCCS